MKKNMIIVLLCSTVYAQAAEAPLGLPGADRGEAFLSDQSQNELNELIGRLKHFENRYGAMFQIKMKEEKGCLALFFSILGREPFFTFKEGSEVRLALEKKTEHSRDFFFPMLCPGGGLLVSGPVLLKVCLSMKK